MSSSSELRLSVETSGEEQGRVYEMRAASAAEAREWMEAMHAATPVASSTRRASRGGNEGGADDSGQKEASRGSGAADGADAADAAVVIGELVGGSTAAFFGASKVGLLYKTGAGALSAWRQRWFALDRERGALRYFERAAELGAGHWVCALQGTTLRVHRRSFTLSLALGAGRVVTMQAGTQEQMRLWVERLQSSGCSQVDWEWEPSAMTSYARESISTPAAPVATEVVPLAGGVRRATPWEIAIPSFEIKADERGAEYASFPISARRISEFGADEQLTCSRRASEFVELNTELSRLSTLAPALPELPAKRRFSGKLESAYLQARRDGFLLYLRNVARLAQPTVPDDCNSESGAEQAQARRLLRRFLSPPAVEVE